MPCWKFVVNAENHLLWWTLSIKSPCYYNTSQERGTGHVISKLHVFHPYLFFGMTWGEMYDDTTFQILYKQLLPTKVYTGQLEILFTSSQVSIHHKVQINKYIHKSRNICKDCRFMPSVYILKTVTFFNFEIKSIVAAIRADATLTSNSAHLVS